MARLGTRCRTRHSLALQCAVLGLEYLVRAWAYLVRALAYPVQASETVYSEHAETFAVLAMLLVTTDEGYETVAVAHRTCCHCLESQAQPVLWDGHYYFWA